MKSKKDKSNPGNFVFDDDTSDSDEETMAMEDFKSKVNSLQSKSDDLQSDEDVTDDDEDSEEEEEDDEDDEEDEEEDDSSDSDSSDVEINKAPPQLTEEKKSKLSRIKDQLAGIGVDGEDDDDEEIEVRQGNRENELRPESDSSDSESVGEVTKVANTSRKRPLQDNIEGGKDKKPKSDPKREPESELDQKTKFRAKLSKMSLEEIQRLKNKLGLKLFDQKMSGTADEKKKVDYKRENKNRPREMSSKRQVSRFREVLSVSTEVKAPKRDPRFDPICGEYNEKLFKDNYGFVNEYKVTDLKFLKKQLQEEEDPERKSQIKYLIQRTENQLRQLDQDKEKEKEKKEEIEERKAQLKAGIKPVYISKSKQKEKDLVKKYEKLKSSGGLDNYIKKKTKKNVAKDRKRFQKL